MVRVTGLFHATLAVWDVDRAERFYREVLGIRRHATPSYFPGNVVFLDAGNTMIHLIRDSAGMAPTDPRSAPPSGDGNDETAFLSGQEQARRLRIHLALEVDDLDAALDRVKAAGVMILQEIVTRPDGMRCFYFLDTEHNRVELVQH